MYSDRTLDAVREQLRRISAYDFYAERFEEAAIDPSDIDSWEDFRAVPFTGPADLSADLDNNPPTGSLYPGQAMLSFTPAGDDLAPVFDTPADIEHGAAVNARIFERAGLESGDRVINAFGYHVFGTGYVLHRGLEALGAEVIPAGPGESEQAADIITQYDVDAYVGNPSFALKIAEHGASVDVVIGAGEPFTSIPGMRRRVKEAIDAETAVDYFGTRRILPVAAECHGESGLHVVDGNAVVEIIDPDTEDVLPPGSRGEVVVTHVKKEGLPLVRYRTGDLAELSDEPCPACGATVTMPDGVIGRTDQRLKVKGVKVYPESIQTVLAGFEGLTGEYRIEVSRPETTDRLTVVCEGEADTDALRTALGERLLVTPDSVEVVDELGAGDTIVDYRY